MVVSRQPYNVARWKGGRQMRKTAQPHTRSAACSYTINMKYKTVFKRCHICRYENSMFGLWIWIVGLVAEEYAACGGD
jgi:hypothetical protein